MAGSRNRPFLKSSISEIEALFGRSRTDERTLLAIDHELGFRATERARRLRDEVAAALSAAKAPARPTAPKRQVTSDSVLPAPQDRSEAPQATPVHHGDRPAAVAGVRPWPVVPDARNSEERDDGRTGATEILSAWTALEALSPPVTYRRREDLVDGDRYCVADLCDAALPWTTSERSRRNYVLYYEVVIGSLSMVKATSRLSEAFGEDPEFNERAKEMAPIATALLDKSGVLVAENGVAISSLAWALPRALRGELRSLGGWIEAERELTSKLEEMLRRKDRNDKDRPVDIATIGKAFRWLQTTLGLAPELTEEPSFALRRFHYFRSKSPPEAGLLNSFFLADLDQASRMTARDKAPRPLREFLGLEPPSDVFDLLTDRTALEAAVAPKTFPLARWPSPGGYPLVMLQQAAVNLARSTLLGEGGVAAVNGPPGTGKTTLLRDIVAAATFDRAEAMAAFANPLDAFSTTGQRISAGGNAFFHLYALHPSLKGHEVLVASSNNKAVENVSKELPSTRAVGRPEEMAYFRSVSDLMLTTRESKATGGDREEDGSEGSWGLIAAVLGNQKNRSAFQQSFWWDDDLGFRIYLKAAKGDQVVREIKDETGAIIRRVTPAIVGLEKPPSSPEQAMRNWREARARLLALKREVEGDLKTLEAVRGACHERDRALDEAEQVKEELKRLYHNKPELERTLKAARSTAESAETNRLSQNAAVGRHMTTRPTVWARLFRTARSRARSTQNRALAAAAATASSAAKVASDAAISAETAYASTEQAIEAALRDLSRLEGFLADRIARIERWRGDLGGRLVDARLLGQSSHDVNMAAPWVPDSLHRKREDLFIASLAVHRAFIDVCAQKVLHNLSALMDAMSGGLRDEAKRALLADLWSTLFLVVPVVSTTFASVNRMLGALGPGSIGWLLIDEAGQAVPQAAVGALMRSRRAVIVGDPLQIPPVVTLPERAVGQICEHFDVASSAWAAPSSSVQTLADRASSFQAVFQSDSGNRRVGMPLLVHRRCAEPMFSISNRIAYAGQMVHAVAGGFGPIGRVIGSSCWIDVDGEAETKWCKAEGDVVIELLQKLAYSGLNDPDLFIISPFRIVAQELRRRIDREQGLPSAVLNGPGRWTQNRVGTIHTVQGREAEATIVVLGAPASHHHGARRWAAGSPNIFNVAVSRAKRSLYVVGSHGAWSGVGHAAEVGRTLEVFRHGGVGSA